MKYWFSSICICLVCLLFALPASAHPGRTDSNGGHHSGSSYHYHHGYPAHQHTNGICPYDFDDKTGDSSGSNNDSSSNDNIHLPSSSLGDNTSASTKALWDDYIAPIICIGFFAFWPVSYVCSKVADHRRKKAAAREQKRRFDEDKAKYTALYAGKTLAELSGMPSDVEVGIDGFPKSKGSDGWGEEFTFYVSRTGSSYHQKSACTRGAYIKIHACALGTHTPCAKCKPRMPDLKWFAEYKRIQKICNQYQITLLEPKHAETSLSAEESPPIPLSDANVIPTPAASNDRLNNGGNTMNKQPPQEPAEHKTYSPLDPPEKKSLGGGAVLAIIVLSFLLVMATVVCGILFSNNTALSEQVDAQASEISALTESAADSQKAISSLQEQLADANACISILENEGAFLSARAVIVFPGRANQFQSQYFQDTYSSYHTYDCERISLADEDCFVYDRRVAESAGYSPCPACIGAENDALQAWREKYLLPLIQADE